MFYRPSPQRYQRSYTWTVGERYEGINYHCSYVTWAAVKLKPEKKIQSLTEFKPLTSTSVLLRSRVWILLWHIFFSRFNFTAVQVVYKTAMVIDVFTVSWFCSWQGNHCLLWNASLPVYSGKQMVNGDLVIFSANRSFLLRKRIIDVSVNHLLLQMESKSFMLSIIRFWKKL